MSELYLSRLSVRRDVALSTILPLLIGNDGATPHAGKSLMWSAFHQDDGERDFLWREDSNGVFYALAPRPAGDAQGLFSVDPPKAFTPDLSAGDRLDFKLRANPVVRRSLQDGSGRSKKHDVMMDALSKREKSERKSHRNDDARAAALAWLNRQGEAAGFAVDEDRTMVSGIKQHEVPRKQGGPMKFTSIDIDGQLTVTDPCLFLDGLKKGFGSAKAYGCGLMLVRPAW